MVVNGLNIKKMFSKEKLDNHRNQSKKINFTNQTFSRIF